MEISSKEIRSKLKSGLPIILDESYTLLTDKEMIFKITRFIKYRAAISKLTTALREGLEPKNKDELWDLFHNEVGKPFQYVPEANDCDNSMIDWLSFFSGSGKAIAGAVVPGHSLGMYFNDRGNATYVETTTGSLVAEPTHIKVLVMI